jgi:hypothetical protein
LRKSFLAAFWRQAEHRPLHFVRTVLFGQHTHPSHMQQF